ncbi:MAG: hypothetical protein N2444_10235, partial [Methylocystis sp.]|nr:hypothetical protein [Methylocystis sp.]
YKRQGVAFASIQLLRWTLELLCGRRFDLRAALIGAIALPAVIGGIFVTAQSGSLDAFVERFIDDKGSARARALMFQLYDFFPIDELLFGPDPARLAWVQNSLGIEYGIENSWLGLAFQYGALMALFFIAGFFALIWEFWRRSAPGAAIPIAFHLTLLSSASGVSVKTFMFNQFAILLLAFFGRRSEETASERRVVRLSPLARKSL